MQRRFNSTTIMPLWDKYWRTRSVAARNALVVEYLPMVQAVAMKAIESFSGRWELRDLVSEGVIGLIHAIEFYKPSLGVKFGTFARQRVAGAMLDARRSQGHITRTALVGTSRRERVTKDLTAKLGREPDQDELKSAVAEAFPALSPRRIESILRARKPDIIPLAGENEDGDNIGPSCPLPDEGFRAIDDRDENEFLITRLPVDLRPVAKQLYVDGRTVEEVRAATGYSRAVVYNRIARIRDCLAPVIKELQGADA